MRCTLEIEWCNSAGVGRTGGRNKMADRTIDLDGHRGMAAQKATLQRRMLADVEANEEALRLQRRELEEHLLAAPAANGFGA
jgi:hypothetical protein